MMLSGPFQRTRDQQSREPSCSMSHALSAKKSRDAYSIMENARKDVYVRRKPHKKHLVQPLVCPVCRRDRCYAVQFEDAVKSTAKRLLKTFRTDITCNAMSCTYPWFSTPHCANTTDILRAFLVKLKNSLARRLGDRSTASSDVSEKFLRSRNSELLSISFSDIVTEVVCTRVMRRDVSCRIKHLNYLSLQ